ncbi:MAG: hypothetical protein ACRDTD_32275, partial [Pseudonocardiaceae bacterium]
CNVFVTLSSGTRVQVKVEFEKPAPLTGPMEEMGAFRVFKQPDKSGFCGWTVPLADQNLVTITAKYLENRGQADLCGMARAETGHVVDELSKGAIPQRAAPPDAESLAIKYACPLLDSSTVKHVLGADADSPETGFGDWECLWKNRTSGLSVLLAFDRNNRPLTDADGRREEFSNREVRIRQEGDDKCRARVAYRRILDGNGNQAYELLKILVEGSQTPDQLCRPATELAAAAAAKLPPSR